jgi:hypothetical protein
MKPINQIALTLALGMAALSLPAVQAQQVPTPQAAVEEVNNGQDPTKPLTRLDFRYQYQNLPPDDNDNAHIFTPRADKPFVLSPAWSLATRIDLPLFITNAVSRTTLGERTWPALGTCSCRDSSSTR